MGRPEYDEECAYNETPDHADDAPAATKPPSGDYSKAEQCPETEEEHCCGLVRIGWYFIDVSVAIITMMMIMEGY